MYMTRQTLNRKISTENSQPNASAFFPTQTQHLLPPQPPRNAFHKISISSTTGARSISTNRMKTQNDSSGVCARVSFSKARNAENPFVFVQSVAPCSKKEVRSTRSDARTLAHEKRIVIWRNGAWRPASFSASRISPALRNREFALLADRAAFRANSLIRRAGEKKRGKRSRAWGSGGPKA